MAIVKIHYDTDEIKLTRIFDNTSKMGYTSKGLSCKKINDVYGELMFGDMPDDRPIVYASYVTSIDGKIAFADDGLGPLIATNNMLDAGGGKCDYWMLAMLRANSDALITGSGTLVREPNFTGSVYDEDLFEARRASGMSVAPYTIIVTSTGKNIPYTHDVFAYEDFPVIIATSPNGFKNIEKEITHDYFVMPKPDSDENKALIKRLTEEGKGKVCVIVTGSENETNSKQLFKTTLAMGMKKLLVESPVYCHHVMKEGLLDEMFLNTSCVFACGNAIGIGTSSVPFTSIDHPHAEIVSIHMHSPHFIYTRYKMIYGLKANKK